MRKPQFFPTYISLFLFSVFLISSCTQDDLLSNILEDATTEEPGSDPTDPANPADPTTAKVEDLVINTTPCDYTLDSLVANTALDIECQIDLGGKTVSLPSGMILNFKGGEIINGTLNFGATGKIDGDLLNHKLTVTGDVTLINEVFQLQPSRWELIQGKTTSDLAQKNNDNLEDLMEFSKSIGATTFSIDKFDAYFEVSKVTSTTTNQNFYPSSEGLNIPSDFNLFMTDNTFLRVYPTENDRNSTLLAVFESQNIHIKGGTLYGDRDLRNYSEDFAEVGSHLLTIRSGSNVIVDNVNFKMGSSGGLNINSVGFTFSPEYNPTNNILIKNCDFIENRSMSIAITDGYDITIDGNTFKDSSQPTIKSDGGVVGYAINMEPVRKRDQTTGELVFYQKVSDVIIRNNTETGSRQGAFTIYSGDNITIEDNNLQNVVSWSYASNSKVRNNIFNASENPTKPAIIAGGGGETVFNNEISGNTITGYGVGISPYFKDIKIYGNKIYDCIIGVQLKEASDIDIYDNLIKSSHERSRGIMAHIANVNNVDIYNNEIEVVTDGLYFVDLNILDSSSNFKINVFANSFSSGSKFSNSRGIKLENNILNGGLQIVNAEEVNVINNIINATNSSGILLRGKNKSILIEKNNITYPSSGNFSCIEIATTTDASEVRDVNNNCN